MIDTLPPAPDVPCSGCGQPTPYDAGPEDSDAPSYGEHLSTPLGRTYARTHRTRECVQASRARLKGRRIAWPTKEDRAEAAGFRP